MEMKTDFQIMRQVVPKQCRSNKIRLPKIILFVLNNKIVITRMRVTSPIRRYKCISNVTYIGSDKVVSRLK